MEWMKTAIKGIRTMLKLGFPAKCCRRITQIVLVLHVSLLGDLS